MRSMLGRHVSVLISLAVIIVVIIRTFLSFPNK